MFLALSAPVNFVRRHVDVVPQDTRTPDTTVNIPGTDYKLRLSDSAVSALKGAAVAAAAVAVGLAWAYLLSAVPGVAAQVVPRPGAVDAEPLPMRGGEAMGGPERHLQQVDVQNRPPHLVPWPGAVDAGGPPPMRGGEAAMGVGGAEGHLQRFDEQLLAYDQAHPGLLRPPHLVPWPGAVDAGPPPMRGGEAMGGPEGHLQRFDEQLLAYNRANPDFLFPPENQELLRQLVLDLYMRDGNVRDWVILRQGGWLF